MEFPMLTWCERGYADNGGRSEFASRARRMFFDSDIRFTYITERRLEKTDPWLKGTLARK